MNGILPKKKIDMPAKALTAMRSDFFCNLAATIQGRVWSKVRNPIALVVQYAVQALGVDLEEGFELGSVCG